MVSPFDTAWNLLKQNLVQNVKFTGKQLTPEQQLQLMQHINNLGIGPAAVASIASNLQQGLPPPLPPTQVPPAPDLNQLMEQQ